MKKVYLLFFLSFFTVVNLHSQMEFWETTTKGGEHDTYGGIIFKTDANGDNFFKVKHCLFINHYR